MKVLIINWSWYPTGGDWTYVDTLVKFYESRGHEVVPFSMHNEKNFETPYSKFFIKGIDYKSLNKKKSISQGLKVVKSTLYSTEAKKNLEKLLKEERIDIAHVNNIHHYLTPSSILPTLHKHSIPIIWTLHDYVILCPNTTFISHGKICEKCKVDKFYNCVTNTCKKDSVMASAVASTESYINKALNPYKYVDYFICPSKFIESKFIEYGYDKAKFRQIYNPYDIEKLNNSLAIESETKDYIIYVGNLLDVKGVLTLLKAAKFIEKDIYIIGDGEHKEKFIEYKVANNINNVTFLGKQKSQDVLRYVKESLLVVVPSEWYENLPYSLVEAMLLSKPVIGSKIGGIPELVIDNKTGYLFEPGNVEDLVAKINSVMNNKDLLLQLGTNAKEFVYNKINHQVFFDEINKVFESLNLNL